MAKSPATDPRDKEVEVEIDKLYQLPLPDFTAARNAHAARLKKDGNGPAAARVKAIGKPAISAWAVNQLYWRARDVFEALVAAGDQLRTAQRKLLMGGANRQLAELTHARESAIGAALAQAAEFLREAGTEPSQALRQRIGMTLDVIATEGGKASSGRGRWTEDLTPTGFGALAGLLPATATPLRLVDRPAEQEVERPATKAPASAKATERTARLNRARADLAQADSELRVRRGEADRAAAAEKDVASRLDAARADVDEARRRLDEAMARAKKVEEAVQQSRTRSREAASAIKLAEKAVAAARAAIDRLA